VLGLCELYLGICLTTEEKARKNLGQIRDSKMSHDKVDMDNLLSFLLFIVVKCKGNAIPSQAWTGPEGARTLRLPDFKTHVGGKVVSPRHLPPLPPINIPGTH